MMDNVIEFVVGTGEGHHHAGLENFGEPAHLLGKNFGDYIGLDKRIGIAVNNCRHWYPVRKSETPAERAIDVIH